MHTIPVPKDDGLCIPEVGIWSRDKHHFVYRYMDAFTNSMKDKWSGLHYIDLFAGAGIERLKKLDELDWGSALLAAQLKYPFTRLHLCERDAQKFGALRERVVQLRGGSHDQLIRGDANTLVAGVVQELPFRSLSLAFLDPCGLHLDYKTLRVLANKRADLIIFFPDHLDAIRNWKAYYWGNAKSNLDSVLGPNSDWRQVIKQTPERDRPTALRNLYVSQIRKLGYAHFEYERISNLGRPLYLLIYASKSPKGAEIWRNVSEKKPDGQRTFDFQPPAG